MIEEDIQSSSLSSMKACAKTFTACMHMHTYKHTHIDTHTRKNKLCPQTGVNDASLAMSHQAVMFLELLSQDVVRFLLHYPGQNVISYLWVVSYGILFLIFSV